MCAPVWLGREESVQTCSWALGHLCPATSKTLCHASAGLLCETDPHCNERKRLCFGRGGKDGRATHGKQRGASSPPVWPACALSRAPTCALERRADLPAYREACGSDASVLPQRRGGDVRINIPARKIEPMYTPIFKAIYWVGAAACRAQRCRLNLNLVLPRAATSSSAPPMRARRRLCAARAAANTGKTVDVLPNSKGPSLAAKATSERLLWNST